MTERDENTEELAHLLLDVLQQDQPDSALVARYAEDPESLTLEQRADIEMRLGESPGLGDQIRILQGFDVRAAVEDDTAPVPTRAARPVRSGLGDLVARVFSAPILALAGATAAGVFALAVFGPTGAGTDPLPKATTVARALAPAAKDPAPAPTTTIVARAAPPEIDAKGLEQERVRMAQLEANQAVEEERRSQATEPMPGLKDGEQVPEPEAEKKPELIMVASAIDYRSPAGATSRPRGGTLFRGAGIDRPSAPAIVLAVAPEHTGRAASRQPSLFWYLTTPPQPGWQVTFQLAREGAFETEVDVAIPVPTRAGLQRTRLVDVGAHIEFGIEYTWAVTIQPDATDPSRDVAAEGAVRREDLPDAARLALGGESLRNASTLAEAGFWYDALSAVADELEQHPSSVAGRAAYDRLVDAAGLPKLP